MIETLKTKEMKIICILPVIIVLMLFYSGVDFKINYGNYLGVIVSLMGSLFTALSILIVFPKEGKIQQLIKHPSYHKLLKTYLITIFALTVLFIVSIIGDIYGEVHYFQKILFIILLIFTILMIFLNFWILKKMIDLLYKKYTDK